MKRKDNYRVCSICGKLKCKASFSKSHKYWCKMCARTYYRNYNLKKNRSFFGKIVGYLTTYEGII